MLSGDHKGIDHQIVLRDPPNSVCLTVLTRNKNPKKIEKKIKKSTETPSFRPKRQKNQLVIPKKGQKGEKQFF